MDAPPDSALVAAPASLAARLGRHAARLATLLGIAPGRCRLCAQTQAQHAADSGLGLCRDCVAALPRRTGGYCSNCGALFANTDDPPRRCGVCMAHPPPFSRVVFHGVYDDALQESIIQYKYHGKHAVERLLQDMLLVRYTQARAEGELASHDCIIPLPLHPSRLRERGFNQSLELARPLARRWRIPLLAQGLVRSRHTLHQAGLNRDERIENVRRAFLAPQPHRLAGRAVLLVDDVMTTGATLAEAAQACLQAGALRVDCCVLARA